MEDKPETLMDRQFRDLLTTPLWLTLVRLIVPVTWVVGGSILMVRGASDDDILLLLFALAPLLILQLIFELTVGRRLVKKFRAEKMADRRANRPATTPTTSAFPADQSQKTFRKAVTMGAAITVVGLISHFLWFFTDNFDWFFLVMAVFFGLAIADFVGRWRKAKTWAETDPNLKVGSPMRDSLRRQLTNPWRIIVGLVPMVMFLIGIVSLGALVLKTESLLWTFLFWPMMGGVVLTGAFLRRWAFRRKNIS